MFVKTQGRHIIDPQTGSPLILRGFNFTQNYWMPEAIILRTGRDDEAYRFASQLGANGIRLTVSHRFLEAIETPFKYNDAALDWLDLQIKHAKRNSLYVTLALVLPHGGDWLDKVEGKDFRLWHNEGFQHRFVEVWKMLASRYAHEPTVLGYDLFNVPVTDDQSGDAYYALLERAIEQIRLVDPVHIIVVSSLYGHRGEIEMIDCDEFLKFRKLSWDNILYDGHFYDPLDYTHQYAEWMGRTTDGGSYPDLATLETNSKGELMPRDKGYLYAQLKPIFDFSKQHEVAVHLGEIGLTHCCYHNKGGLNWISDVLDILAQEAVGFYYWDFQSQAMGLIQQAGEEKMDETKVNHALASLLACRLRQNGP